MASAFGAFWCACIVHTGTWCGVTHFRWIMFPVHKRRSYRNPDAPNSSTKAYVDTSEWTETTLRPKKTRRTPRNLCALYVPGPARPISASHIQSLRSISTQPPGTAWGRQAPTVAASGLTVSRTAGAVVVL